MQIGEIVNTGEVIPILIQPDDVTKGWEIIEFGIDNLFPNDLAAICRQSVAQRSILNSVVLYCAGEKFEIDAAWENWMKENKLHQVYSNVLLDYKITGNGYLEIVTDKKKSFLKFFHQDSTKVRRKTDGGFMLHPDWNKYTTSDQKGIDIPEYPLFKKGKDGNMHSLYQIKDYEPEFKFYGIPNWYAGLKSAIIDSQGNTWNKERLENKFSIDAILAIPGVDTPEEAKKVQKQLDKLSGAKNAGHLLPLFLKTLGAGESREKMELLETKKPDEGSWLKVNKLSTEQLLMINSWYASLAGFPQNNGFDTERILTDYSVARVNVIKPTQRRFTDIFEEIMSDFGINTELKVINEPPITHDVRFVWEIREEQGLDFDQEDENQKKLLNDNSSTSNKPSV